jgi:hypothetical protein
MTKGKIQFLAGTAIVSLVVFTHTAAMAQDAPSNAELQQRIEALEAEVQQSEMNSAAAAAAAPPPAAPGWWDNTSLSGRMYFDVSNISNKANGVRVTTAQNATTGVTNGNGTGFDIKRLYVGVDHTFNDMFSADVTTDVTYDGTTGVSQLFVKKAYLQAKIDPMLTVRVGAADMPWIPYVEGIYGYRWLEKTITDYYSQGTSSDWGVHALGSFFGGIVNYDIAAINGGGYKKAPIGGDVNRFNQLDYEGRLSATYEGFNVAVGGYTGKLGTPSGVATFHTAKRVDALAAYVANGIRVGVEYFNSNDDSAALVQSSTTGDGANGVSAFGSWMFIPDWSIFGRYDIYDPNDKTAPTRNASYFNVGIDWTPVKTVDLSIAYKHEGASNGAISGTNGTIGGTINGSYNEIGLFGDWQF